MRKIDETDIQYGDENLTGEMLETIVKIVNACIDYDSENPMNAIKTKTEKL